MIIIKKYLFSIIYLILLFSFTIYLILNTFLLKKELSVTKQESENYQNIIEKQVTSDSYIDENIEIKITTYREYDTDIYVADINLKSINYLKTAFANSTYGKNITDKTSSISKEVNAILSINGDYYGVQEKGYVLRNGVIYRNIKRNNAQDLVIYKNGEFEIINEDDISVEKLLEKGAYNVLSFGPSLIDNNDITVTENYEVKKTMTSNPRTAIGIIGENHYVFVVSDGRTNLSEGLSLYELAKFMKSLGVKTLYNLDGGGSSTMYFNGNVVNNPTTMGKTIKERSVSDIVYIGY